MQHVGGVNVLQASQDLVEKVADVVVAQLLGLQQLVKVRLHQSLHDVAGGEGARVKEDNRRSKAIIDAWLDAHFEGEKKSEGCLQLNYYQRYR